MLTVSLLTYISPITSWLDQAHLLADFSQKALVNCSPRVQTCSSMLLRFEGQLNYIESSLLTLYFFESLQNIALSAVTLLCNLLLRCLI